MKEGSKRNGVPVPALVLFDGMVGAAKAAKAAYLRGDRDGGFNHATLALQCAFTLTHVPEKEMRPVYDRLVAMGQRPLGTKPLDPEGSCLAGITMGVATEAIRDGTILDVFIRPKPPRTF